MPHERKLPSPRLLLGWEHQRSNGRPGPPGCNLYMLPSSERRSWPSPIGASAGAPAGACAGGGGDGGAHTSMVYTAVACSCPPTVVTFLHPGEQRGKGSGKDGVNVAATGSAAGTHLPGRGRASAHGHQRPKQHQAGGCLQSVLLLNLKRSLTHPLTPLPAPPSSPTRTQAWCH